MLAVKDDAAIPVIVGSAQPWGNAGFAQKPPFVQKLARLHKNSVVGQFESGPDCCGGIEALTDGWAPEWLSDCFRLIRTHVCQPAIVINKNQSVGTTAIAAAKPKNS
jgi:hypothetical protein